MKLYKKHKSDVPAWFATIYIDTAGHKSLLGIKCKKQGELSAVPLILPVSSIDYPKKVMAAVVDAGADIDPNTDYEALKKLLNRETITYGHFSSSIGWVDGYFFTPEKTYGKNPPPIMTEEVVLSKAVGNVSQSKSLKKWQSHVLPLAFKSTFCMLAIFMAFAAPLLRLVLGKLAEGMIINLAGDTSRGKSTVLYTARSVAGPPSMLVSWKLTTRRLAEEAAASSDIFFALDDLDKISKKPDFVERVSDAIHMFAAGEATKYSSSVKDQFPDLSFGCMAMTGAKDTIDNLYLSKGSQREGNEKVRAPDIKVPDPKDGGIWDRTEKDDIPTQMSDEMLSLTEKYHGSALPVWLDFLTSSKDIKKDTMRYINQYMTKINVSSNDGITHRMAKKFAHIYAAGALAREADIIPWSLDEVGNAVLRMHRNASATLNETNEKLLAGFKELSDVLEDGDYTIVIKKNETPVFDTNRGAETYARKDKHSLTYFINRDYFMRCFDGEFLGKQALSLLKKAGALHMSSQDLITVQCRVVIKSVSEDVIKRRYIQADARKLNDLISKLDASCQGRG
jgi:hypothetical protein